MKKLSIFLASIFIVLSFVSLTFADSNQKSSWYIGFGIGSGDGSMEINGESKSYDDHFDSSGFKIS